MAAGLGSPRGVDRGAGEGGQPVSPRTEVTGFPAPCELTDIWSKSPSC